MKFLSREPSLHPQRSATTVKGRLIYRHQQASYVLTHTQIYPLHLSGRYHHLVIAYHLTSSPALTIKLLDYPFGEIGNGNAS